MIRRPLRWKVVLPVVALVALLHLLLFIYIQQTDQRLFSVSRAEIQARNVKALSGVLTGAYQRLLELAQVAARTPGNTLHESLAQLYQTLSPQGELEGILLYSAAGDLEAQWGNLFDGDARLVQQTLQGETPAQQIHCPQQCMRYITVPVLKEGRVGGVILLIVNMQDMVLSFNQITGADLGIASASKNTESDIPAWSLDFSLLTHRHNSLQVLSLLSERVPRIEQVNGALVEAFDRVFEVRLFSSTTLDTGNTAWIILADVTEATQQIRQRVRWLALLLGVSFLLVSALLYQRFFRVIERPLIRITQQAKVLTQPEKVQPQTDESIVVARDDELGEVYQYLSEGAEAYLVQQQGTEVLKGRISELAQDVEQEKAYSAGLLDSGETLVLMQDKTGVVHSMNAVCTQTFVDQKHQLANTQSFVELFCLGGGNQAAQAQLKSLYNGESAFVRMETHSLNLAGQVRILSWVHSSIHSHPDQPPMILSIAVDITERRKAEEQLEWLSGHDPVTSLANKNLFLDVLPSRLAHHQAGGRSAALVCCEVMNLKESYLVTAEGDELFSHVGARLANTLRDDDFIARFGDNLFLLLLSGLKTDSDATAVAGKIHKAFKAAFHYGGQEVLLSVKLGVSLFPRHSDDAMQLISYAETALQEAKRSLVETVCFDTVRSRFDPEEAQRLNEQVRAVFERGAASLLYSPVIGLQASSHAASALVKPRLPEHLSHQTPADYADLIRQTSAQQVFNTWMLREVCRQNRLWSEAFPADGMLVIPVFVAGSDDVSTLVRQLKELMPDCIQYGGRLKLLLRSTDFLAHRPACTVLIKEAHKLGLGVMLESHHADALVALLDKETQFDGLILPVRVLQCSDEKWYPLLESGLKIARRSAIEVIVTELEPETMASVAQLDAGFIEGTAVAKAMSAAAFLNWIRQREKHADQ